MLAPIYSWFTEGFDTTDLQEAKALLDEPVDQRRLEHLKSLVQAEDPDADVIHSLCGSDGGTPAVPSK